MERWADQVIKKWRTEGVKINIGAPFEFINSAENILSFNFPEDFKELYLKMDGFKDLDWQEHMFYFWPLERIIEEHSESSDKNFVGFCDFLLSSHYIGFNKDRTGIFKKYSIESTEDDFVAKTFEEAVGMINSSSDLIY